MKTSVIKKEIVSRFNNLGLTTSTLIEEQRSVSFYSIKYYAHIFYSLITSSYFVVIYSDGYTPDKIAICHYPIEDKAYSFYFEYIRA